MESDLKERVVQFARRHGWLCIFCGGLAIGLVIGLLL